MSAVPIPVEHLHLAGDRPITDGALAGVAGDHAKVLLDREDWVFRVRIIPAAASAVATWLALGLTGSQGLEALFTAFG